MTRRAQAECSVPALTEAQLSKQVREYAALMGWEVYSFEGPGAAFRKRTLVDLYLVHEGMQRALWVELKREGETPTVKQREFLEQMQRAGVEAAWWQPSDWPKVERTLERRRR